MPPSNLTRWVNKLKPILLLGGVAGFGAAPSVLADTPSADQWEFSADIYGWMPEITAETASADITFSFRDILENLNMTFMGGIGARKGKWSLFEDTVYLNLGGDKTARLKKPVGHTDSADLNIASDADVTLKAWVVTLGGGYSLIETDKHRLDLLAGARYLSVRVGLDVGVAAVLVAGPIRSAPRGTNIRISESGNVWDGIGGVRGQVNFDKHWYGNYYADIGAGQSKLTWQLLAGGGYRFEWGDAIAGWRYLDWDFKDSSKVEGLTVNGPYIGAKFHF